MIVGEPELSWGLKGDLAFFQHFTDWLEPDELYMRKAFYQDRQAAMYDSLCHHSCQMGRLTPCHFYEDTLALEQALLDQKD